MSFEYTSTKREKIQIEAEKILKYVSDKDLDYREILDYLAFSNKSTKNKVREVLDFVIDYKGYKVTEDWIITLKDKDLPDWFKKIVEREKMVKELDDAMKKIEELPKKEDKTA